MLGTITAHPLESKPLLKTHLKKLNDYLNFFNPDGQITEWGAPHGNFSRLIPALIAQSLDKNCLWISDRSDLKFYPTSWFDLGFDLSKIHFMTYNKPLKIIRSALDEETYPLLIIDSCEFITQAELNYLSHSAKRKKISIFLLRHFFLSNRNGNPFSKYRFNSDFSLADNSFSLSSIKGKNKNNLKLHLREIFNG